MKNSKIINTRVLFLLILLLGLGLRIVSILNSSTIEIDGTVYASLGEKVAKGSFREVLKGVFPPLYPFLIGCFHIFIDDLELAGRFVSLVFGLLLIWAIFYFTKILYDEEKAVYGSCFIAIHPYLIRFSGQVLSESVATFFFTVGILFFYNGWIRNNIKHITLSAILISCTYLTRPEFIIYFIPLSFFLLVKKRFLSAMIFFIFFLAFAFPYIYYMRIETGIWIISKKALLMKEVTHDLSNYRFYLIATNSLSFFLKNIPSVIYYFFDALFLPFLIIGIAGFKNVQHSYKLLSGILIVTHIMSISLVTSSSRRFSIEFVPLMSFFIVEGIYVIRNFIAKYSVNRKLFWIFIMLIFFISFIQSYVPANKGRLLNKKAGLFLLSIDPGKKIASRLPFVSFYSKGEWVNIYREISKIKNCEELSLSFKKNNIEYFIVDEKMYRENELLRGNCLLNFTLVKEFTEQREFVNIYRINKNE